MSITLHRAGAASVVLYPNADFDARLAGFAAKPGDRLVLTTIGGGSGPASLVDGLHQYTQLVNVITPVTDNGGSTGLLRDYFDIPAVGDTRKHLSNLFENSPPGNILRNIFEERLPKKDSSRDALKSRFRGVVAEFDTESALPERVRDFLNTKIGQFIALEEERAAQKGEFPYHGACVGNLILTALYFDSDESMDEMMHAIERNLGAYFHGRVIPVSEANLDIAARFAGNIFMYGEHQIAYASQTVKSPFEEIFFVKRKTQGQVVPTHTIERALRILGHSDIITIGPGSIGTSYLPVLISRGMPTSLKRSRAVRILLANIYARDILKLEEEHFQLPLSLHVQLILDHLRKEGRAAGIKATDFFDVILAHDPTIKKGRGPNFPYAQIDIEETLERFEIPIITADLQDPDNLVRHHAANTAKAVLAVQHWKKELMGV